MKICSVECEHALGIERKFGILYEDNTFINLQKVWEIKFSKENHLYPHKKAAYIIPNSLHLFLTNQAEPLSVLQETEALWQELKKKGDIEGIEIPLKKLKLRAPLDQISTYRDFYAHEKHVATGFKKRNEPVPPSWYEIPAYYKGGTLGFIGPEEQIHWPKYTEKLDYELELGLVMAKGGKNISQQNAMKHVLGFTILNDISARDIQKKEMAIRLGPAKGKDFCSVMGPVITTIDEFNFKEPDLLMLARINGQEWSRGQSGDSHFTFAQMIEHASLEEWLAPADFLGSGTVGTGCGLELDKWIQPGDEIELEIEKIGILKNKVGKK
jgi:2-keto-4-pentenoate hydratase/2-oxohepta-3-ene-1,7-dioic acid hydratase in catechol pathway